jgi:hypothetical protein
MKVLIIFICFLLYLPLGWTQVNRIVFKDKYIEVGKIYEAILEIQKPSYEFQFHANDLNQKFIGKNLFIYKVKKISQHENNADFILVNADLIIKDLKLQDLNLSINGTSFSFVMNNSDLKIEGLDLKDVKEFKIFDFSSSWNWLRENWKIVSSIIFLIILVIVWILLKYRQKKYIRQVLELRRKEKLEFYLNLFKTSAKKEDFDLIFKDKGIWINFMKDKTKSKEFLNYLEGIIYKKTWNSDELENVQLLKNKILGELSGT